MTLETKSIDIKGLLDGTVADIPLRNNDVLFIPSMTEMNSDQTLTIEGEVNFPGVYVYSENTTLFVKLILIWIHAIRFLLK